jgi:hypothetical protein
MIPIPLSVIAAPTSLSAVVGSASRPVEKVTDAPATIKATGAGSQKKGVQLVAGHRAALLPGQVEGSVIVDRGPGGGELTVVAGPFARRQRASDLLARMTFEEKTAQIRVIDCGAVLWGIISWEKVPGTDTYTDQLW